MLTWKTAVRTEMVGKSVSSLLIN